jgi:hypothetical protein
MWEFGLGLCVGIPVGMLLGYVICGMVVMRYRRK